MLAGFKLSAAQAAIGLRMNRWRVCLRLQCPQRPTKVIKNDLDRRHQEQRRDGGGDQPEGEAGGQRDQDLCL